MAHPAGSILVVHPDRRAQRVLQRILGPVGRDVIVVGELGAATELLDDGAPAIVVLASSVRSIAGADAIVAGVTAGGCRACILVHDDAKAVSPALFDEATLSHLVTAAMPVLAEELFTTVQKLLRDDLFGIDKYLGWGAFLADTELATADDRLRALDDLRDDLDRIQIGRRQQAAALLAADELILNAVHHGPIDDTGVHYLRDLARDSNRALTGRERPRLRWGCDGRWLAIGVHDHFGSVDAATLVRFVRKSLARRGQVRTEGPGAGIGLAMTYTAVSQLIFDVVPGKATEAIALVDVRPWPPSALPPCASFHLFFGDG